MFHRMLMCVNREHLRDHCHEKLVSDVQMDFEVCRAALTPLRFFCITIGEFATNESVRKV